MKMLCLNVFFTTKCTDFLITYVVFKEGNQVRKAYEAVSLMQKENEMPAIPLYIFGIL